MFLFSSSTSVDGLAILPRILPVYCRIAVPTRSDLGSDIPGYAVSRHLNLHGVLIYGFTPFFVVFAGADFTASTSSFE